MIFRAEKAAAVARALAHACPPENQWSKHVLDLNEYPMATCLDGSPGAYYIRIGKDSDNKGKSRKGSDNKGKSRKDSDNKGKVLVTAQGGAWCDFRSATELDECEKQHCCAWHGFAGSCSERAKTVYGSSNYEFEPSEWACNGMLSLDPKINPAFHDWTVVMLQYCDGASFSGLNVEPIELDGEIVYSRGNFIYQAIIDSLQKEGQPLHAGNGPTHLVVSGDSAGGLTTYLHAHQWREALSDDTLPIAVLPDDGFFHRINHPKSPQGCPEGYNYNVMMESIFNHSKPHDGLPQQCLADVRNQGKQAFECMFAQNALPYIPDPVFVLQSSYDQWQTRKILGIDEVDGSASSNDFIQFGVSLTESVKDSLASRLNKEFDGAFMDSCTHHTTTNQSGPYMYSKIEGVALNKAIASWVNWWSSAGDNGEAVSLIADMSRGTMSCTMNHFEEYKSDQGLFNSRVVHEQLM